MAERKSLGKKLRYEILARDSFTCRYCGAQPDASVLLVVDHIQPVAEGGTNDPTNLITACQPCNAGKGARSPEAAVPTEKDRLRLLQEFHEQRASADAIRQTILARDAERQSLVDLWCSVRGAGEIETRQVASLVRWAREFGVEELARFIEIAVVKMPHASDYTMCRYIGGIARKVREEVEEAGEREPNREMTTDDR